MDVLSKILVSGLFDGVTSRKWPIVFADVGARGGIHERWKQISEYMDIIGFEPDEEECRKLNDAGAINETYIPIALHSKSGKHNLYITKNSACSSLYPPNEEYLKSFSMRNIFKIEEEKMINCDTLDGFAKKNSNVEIDILKLDTQGNEFDILIGGLHTLSHVIMLDIEVEFTEMYKHQPLFSDIDNLLRENGFLFFDFLGKLGRAKRGTINFNGRSQILWAHALYIKNYANLCKNKTHCIEFSKAMKTIFVLIFLGYYDYAFELSVIFFNSGVIDGNMAQEVVLLLESININKNSSISVVRGKTVRFLNKIKRYIEV